MKPQQLVTPVIFLVISSQLHVGGAESACQKYKDDPCADIICAYETWMETSFDLNDKLNLTSDAETDGCVLPWVRTCEAIADQQSCRKAGCDWQPGRRVDDHCTKEFCWEFSHPQLCDYFWPECDWKANSHECVST